MNKSSTIEINKKFKNKDIRDSVVKYVFFLISLLCSGLIIFIIIYIAYKGIAPFSTDYLQSDGSVTSENIYSFFIGTRWSYDGNGTMIFLLLTTIFTALLSLVISIPVSILTALFIIRMAPKGIKTVLRSIVELLSAIPSVIFGLFGLAVINPMIKNFATLIGIQTYGGKSILGAIIILAIMCIPTITLTSCDAIASVDKNMINASLALGASKTQTNMKIVLKSAQSGIFAGIILGIGRALGEATAVQMVIGNNSNGLGFYNVFNIGNTLTSAMLSGIGEAVNGTLGYDTRFSLGVVLIILILVSTSLLNITKKKMDPLKKKEKHSLNIGSSLLVLTLKDKVQNVKEFCYQKHFNLNVFLSFVFCSISILMVVLLGIFIF
jgi:phosphate transport system permease protein